MSSCGKRKVEETGATMTEVKSCNDWPKLTMEEIVERLGTVTAWKLIEGSIPKLERTFTCVNFQAALDFINAAGAVAEKRNHHPDFHLTGYRNIQIVIYSHGLSGLTENDFDLCKNIDAECKVKYSPKFLKENPHVAYTAL